MEDYKSQITLVPGKFYEARDGAVWCCFRLRDHWSPGTVYADCVCLDNSQQEYFFLDGRYDSAGVREHTLVREINYIDWKKD